MSDPYKYFRVEAREISEQLQSGLLELERRGSQAELTARLLRLAHTLKGAARVVKQLEIAKLAHEFEDLLEPLRNSERELSRPEIDLLLAPVDALARLVDAIGPAAPLKPAPSVANVGDAAPPPAPARPNQLAPDAKAPTGAAPVSHPEEPARAAPSAPLEHVETLMDGVAELGFQLGGLRHALPELRSSHALAEQLSDRLDPRRQGELGPGSLVALRALVGDLEARLGKLEREMSTHLERAARELGQVRDRVDQLRLIAAGTIFGALARTTRDAAVSLGKHAIFEARGADVRLDAEVLSAVQRALVQAVRNAVAHGIELDHERARAGKPREGRVVLEVERRGKQIRFCCRDDGRGVDLAEVQREAERLGRMPQKADPPNPDQLLALLLRGGISTSARVTEVSGRGVGLDLIREALAGVGGNVELTTEPGRGTSLALSVPASLSALEALVVEAGGQPVALPLSAVVQALRVPLRELSRTAESTSIDYEGELLQFIPLARLLRRPSARSTSPEHAWSAVIVRSGATLLALGVDRLLGCESVVARALPDSARVDATVLGATLDADGNPRLLLDPDALVASAAGLPAPAHAEALVRRSILVIDDSLTTRMLEQSILESAGYEVTLATSGEQGLELARERRYDLFLVDVEMPGMDGFTFIEQSRADPRLSLTPAVLVTSRATAADLARGKAVGASGHIAKGEFDQLVFLEQIARLMR
jgi:two-component system chemotaxis sensor kinase CheA